MSDRGFERYVALGDSQTEGIDDRDGSGGYRGWADRLAEHLAEANPELRYANLAVRGRRTAQIREEQLGAALALRPDLATVLAGMNDLIRPRCDVRELSGHLEDMVAALAASGSCVVTFTFPDITRLVPLVRPLRGRVLRLNARIRSIAARHGAVLVETFPYAVTSDPRLWSTDRIHATPLGHERIAAAAAHALALPGSDASWREPLPSPPARRIGERAREETHWLRSFILPWAVRRLRGRSSGDGRRAKRPHLAPVHPHAGTG